MKRNIYGIYEDCPLPENSPFAFKKWDNISSMTAIATVPMTEGFIIGADSLRQVTTPNGKSPTEGQKVFSFQRQQISLAYAWCGDTVLFNADNPEQVFINFRDQTAASLEVSTTNADLESFWKSFYSHFVEHLKSLDWTDSSVIADFSFIENKIAKMLAVGFVGTTSFAVGLHVLRGESGPIVILEPYLLEQRLFGFSGNVKENAALSGRPETRSQALNLVREFIQSGIDAPDCPNIGGSPHVGLVKPDSFEWLIPFSVD